MQPGTCARRAETSATGTIAMPAISATPINGMARKFNTSPANVTRENTSALTGKSIASTASDAANIAAAGRVTRATTDNLALAALAADPVIAAGSANLACSAGITTGTTTRMASVAPNVRTNAGSVAESGSVATRQAAANASVLSGGPR